MPDQPDQPTPDELDAVLDLITAEQSEPSRGTTYLGVGREGIAAELGELGPDWTTTVRVARQDGRIVGAVVAEWDTDNGRAWVLGPWVAEDDAAWERWARPLVDAVLAQVPDAAPDRELAGDVANTRLAALAGALGWPAGEVNHVFVADAEAARHWPDPLVAIRPAGPADAETLRPLHDQEFPASYADVARLLPDPPHGKFTVFIAEHDSRFLGYAAGRVQPDGDGYLDFLAVPDAARGHRAGRDLVVTIGRWLVDAAPNANVNLTVQDHRLPARRLYESLGFRLEVSMVGYRQRLG